jgi:hypothetical protein
VIHPTWSEGSGTDLPDGEITYLMEKISLFIYLLLLRAQHHIQQAIREGVVENDQWDYESFLLFYVILDGYCYNHPISTMMMRGNVKVSLNRLCGQRS